MPSTTNSRSLWIRPTTAPTATSTMARPGRWTPISTARWQTILLGRLGLGGKGVYALNVTDPDNFDAGDVMWEFTSADDSDMGVSMPQPTIARMSAASGWPSSPNGYNSAGGLAKLFVLDLKTGAKLAEISTGVGSDNGLSTPTPVDVDGDRITDYVYAGDLKGNLWKFDVTSHHRRVTGRSPLPWRLPAPLHRLQRRSLHCWQPPADHGPAGSGPASHRGQHRVLWHGPLLRHRGQCRLGYPDLLCDPGPQRQGDHDAGGPGCREEQPGAAVGHLRELGGGIRPDQRRDGSGDQRRRRAGDLGAAGAGHQGWLVPQSARRGRAAGEQPGPAQRQDRLHHHHSRR